MSGGRSKVRTLSRMTNAKALSREPAGCVRHRQEHAARDPGWSGAQRLRDEIGAGGVWPQEGLSLYHNRDIKALQAGESPAPLLSPTGPLPTSSIFGGLPGREGEPCQHSARSGKARPKRGPRSFAEGRTRPSGRSREETSQPSDVTVAVPGNRDLRKALRPQLSGHPRQGRPQSLGLACLEAAAAAFPAGSSRQRRAPRWDAVNSSGVPKSAPRDEALLPAVPRPLQPRSQTGAAVSSAPGRSPPQLTGCYYSL